MRTMTCKQLGGPCDLAHHGATADEVIKARDRHLREMVDGGDDQHQPALQDMKGRWKHIREAIRLNESTTVSNR
jgi:hypothetical protein